MGIETSCADCGVPLDELPAGAGLVLCADCGEALAPIRVALAARYQEVSANHEVRPPLPDIKAHTKPETPREATGLVIIVMGAVVATLGSMEGANLWYVSAATGALGGGVLASPRPRMIPMGAIVWCLGALLAAAVMTAIIGASGLEGSSSQNKAFIALGAFLGLAPPFLLYNLIVVLASGPDVASQYSGWLYRTVVQFSELPSRHIRLDPPIDHLAQMAIRDQLFARTPNGELRLADDLLALDSRQDAPPR